MTKPPTTRRCVLCHAAPPNRSSDICPACHARLEAEGRKWCQRGQHGPLLAEWGGGRACRACEQSRGRGPGYGACDRCQAPLRGHPRCKGCTRLLHGQAGALCPACARDRANGVPPLGYSWRELRGIG